ncbi:MAG: YezD family protein [Candidatus Omnitrophica bacterium]|nr:YezD family protein [Candidatus Omnitrophota bacterium]
MFDIHKAIQEISYGSVQIHIQDGKVVQVDKISKLRMR